MCPYFAAGAPTTDASADTHATTTPGIASLGGQSLTSQNPDKCLAKNPPTNLGRAFLTRKRDYCVTEGNYRNCSLFQARGAV